MSRHLLILLVLCYAVTGSVKAQNTPEKKDSAKVYREIESYSNRRPFSRFVYRLFFRPVKTAPPVPGKKKKAQVQKPYSKFEGKIIRSINITTLDPFGNSVTDTSSVKQNFFFRLGNGAHIKSTRLTIRNLLLIHKNQSFDSLLVKESERLIRSQRYVHEVAFSVVSVGKDSVDIFILELDIWSLTPAFAVSTTAFKVDLRDRNFLGTGHEFQTLDTWYSSTGGNDLSANYTIPNIKNTYINTNIHYALDEYKNSDKSINVERPFFSPFAKWAAGILVSQQYRKDSIVYHESGYVPFNKKFNSYDYWAGNSRQIFKGNSENARTTNLILAARYLQVDFLENPEPIYDSLRTYTNDNFYFGSIGITTRKYIQDKYIFHYGITEDVPTGKVYSVTAGYQVKNNTGRMYLGGRYSVGGFQRLGYVSADFEYGTFFSAGKPEQGVFTAGLNYFTGLFEVGRWKIRQFIKPLITYGIKRKANEYLTINSENGIRGFNPPDLRGTNKFLMTLQTQTYSPWSILGFHFGPYLFYSMGLLSNAETGFKKSKVYSQYGIGFLFKNEYLIFNNFQFSIAFYPVIPGVGENVFRTNPNSASDFGFRDFQIGKPGLVTYQ